jgi:hypothetical protein
MNFGFVVLIFSKAGICWVELKIAIFFFFFFRKVAKVLNLVLIVMTSFLNGCLTILYRIVPKYVMSHIILYRLFLFFIILYLKIMCRTYLCRL